MRHAKKINHLSRKAPHRALMLSNMATSLILHKRISTTVAKAKALRKYVEPLITKSKNNTTHSRRIVFSYLQNKQSVTTLFGEVASRIGDRPGGYTRIIKMGDKRLGDNAEMCMMELIDFNDVYQQEPKKGKTKTRRRGRRAGKKETKASQEAPIKVKPSEKSVDGQKKKDNKDNVESKKESNEDGDVTNKE